MYLLLKSNWYFINNNFLRINQQNRQRIPIIFFLSAKIFMLFEQLPLFCWPASTLAIHLSSSCCGCVVRASWLNKNSLFSSKYQLRQNLTRRVMNFKARLSLPILSNSTTRFSYGWRPDTSRIKSRTNLACLLCYKYVNLNQKSCVLSNGSGEGLTDGVLLGRCLNGFSMVCLVTLWPLWPPAASS